MNHDGIVRLLLDRCFTDAVYFAAILSGRDRGAHLLAGISCCGCVGPHAEVQRMLEGVPTREPHVMNTAGLSPCTKLAYEGFFHLVEARRADDALSTPRELHEVMNEVADDLAFFSRRELPSINRRHAGRTTAIAAAMFLRQLTGSDQPLPGVAPVSLRVAGELLRAELDGTGGDAAFLARDAPGSAP